MSRPALLLIAAAVVALPSGTVAQDQVIIREVRKAEAVDRPQEPAGDDVVEEDAVVQAPAQVMMLNEAQFDMWVFGGAGNAVRGRSARDDLVDGHQGPGGVGSQSHRLAGLDERQRGQHQAWENPVAHRVLQLRLPRPLGA